MKPLFPKTLLFLGSLLPFLFLPTGCHRDPFEEELDELDRIIEQRETFREAFEERAVPLREAFRRAEEEGPDSLRWVYADRLRQYYLGNQLDSVEFYTRQMSRHAVTDLQKMRTSLAEIRLTSFKNMEMTALDRYHALDTARFAAAGLRQDCQWTEIRLLVEAKHHNKTYRGVPLDSLLTAARLRYAAMDTLTYYGKINQAHIWGEGTEPQKGIDLMESMYAETENPVWKSIFSNYAAYFKGLSGDQPGRIHWLIQSSVNDFKAANRNYLSLYQLARILYKEGDFKRAERYMQMSMSDVSSAGFSQRMRFSGPALVVIGDAVNREHTHSRNTLIVLVAILIILLGAIGLLLLLLSRHSALLETTNRQLAVTNARLQDANRIREHYINRYMTLATTYLDESENQRRMLKQTLRSGGPEALAKTLREPSGIHARFQEYFKSFDETFLKLYPDFVDKVNALLQEEARFPVTEEAELPTELRILAAIRIGITESGEIAKFLNCSPATVYTYRSRMKASALCEKDEFEERIKTL